MKYLFLLGLIGLLLVGGCKTGAQSGANVGPMDQKVKLLPNEEVQVKDTELKLTLKEVKRSWRADGKGEFATATIDLKLKTMEIQRSLNLGEFAELGEYKVTLTAANPFGKTDCEVQVVRQ